MRMAEELNLNDVLRAFASDESRANAVYALVQSNNVDVPKKDVLSAVHLLNKVKKFVDAARLAKLVCPEEAPRLYENEINVLEAAQKFESAAQLCHEAGFRERELQNLENIDFVSAARRAEEYCLFEKSLDLYERANMPADAARLAEQLKQLARAADNYEKAGLTFDAFRMLRDSGQHERAVILWVSVGKKDFAASYAKNHGFNELAERLYREAIDGTMQTAGGADADAYVSASFIAKEGNLIDVAFSVLEKGLISLTNDKERERVVNELVRLCRETKQPERAQAYIALEPLLKKKQV